VHWVITTGVLRPTSDGIVIVMSSSPIAETKDSKDSRGNDEEYRAVKPGRCLGCRFVVGGLC
jgi:hypothetical protein